MTPLTQVLSRLEKVKKQGDGYVARCPAHDDRVPSLSITEARDGRVLLTCHAGCSTERVIEAMGLAWTDLFPDDARQPVARSARRLVRAYDYLDAGGQLLYQVVRYAPKAFRQRRPDGQGGWVWHLRGMTPVLYRLPEVLRAVATGRVVFVVEGEKDADALSELGVVATTCPMGAGKWSETYSDTLRGARVVIVPDRDEVGLAHAKAVARSLVGVAEAVRIVTLPDLPAKGDVSDWLAAGGTLDEIKALVQAAPVVDLEMLSLPVDSDALSPVGVLVSEVERQAVDWVWPGRLAVGKLTILDGDPGLGKSTLYCELAARLTRRRPWPDETACEAGGVVLVTAEDGIGDTIRPRLEEAGAALDRCLVVQTVPDADDPEAPARVPVLPDDLPLLKQAVERVEARLLIIDPLMAHLGAETNSYRDQDVRRALAPLSVMAEEMGVAVLVIRHLNKMSGGSALYRGGGSIGIIGAARVGLMVGRDPEDEAVRVLACSKNNLAEVPASLAFQVVGSAGDEAVPVVRWLGETPVTAQDLCTPPGRGEGTKQGEAAEWLEAQLAEGPRAAAELYEAAEAIGISARTLRKARRRVAETERIGGIGGGGRWYWSLREPVSMEGPGAKGSAKWPKWPTPVNGPLRPLSKQQGGDGQAGPPPCPYEHGDPVTARGRPGVFLEADLETGRYAVRHEEGWDGVCWYPAEDVEPAVPF